LIDRASHDHALFRDDNAQVYYFPEEAMRGTTFAASIKPCQRRKDGRGSWQAIVSQYAGVDNWCAKLKSQIELLHTRKWKEQSNFSLDHFIFQQRNVYVSTTQCANHVNFQLPNQGTRVQVLLDAIENNHAPLQAAMALFRNDTGPGGKMDSFEDTAAFLLAHDPVAKNRKVGGKRPIANISNTNASDSRKSNSKAGIGKTGVHFRFYDNPEYTKLSHDQKAELKEYHDPNEQKSKGQKLGKHGKLSNGKSHQGAKSTDS